MKERVEVLLGARVVAFDFVHGRGYTHTGRHRAVLDDGRTAFVKSAVDDLSAGWLRLEHVVYANVQGAFLPGCLAYDDREGLPLLVLEDLSSAYWPPPWRAGDIASVRAALDELAATDAPDGLTPAHEWKADWSSGWASVRADPAPFLSTGVASRPWLEASIAVLETAARRAPLEDGRSLLHLDVRSDNIALTDRGARLVDWNWASRGNPLADRVAWAPSLSIETGAEPETVAEGEGWASSRRWSRGSGRRLPAFRRRRQPSSGCATRSSRSSASSCRGRAGCSASPSLASAEMTGSGDDAKRRDRR